MKISNKWVLLFFGLGVLSFQVKANEVVEKIEKSKIEVPVYGVFAPEYGFDDNDDVQLVIDGYLPNSCYQKSKTQVTIHRETQQILVQQYAKKDETEVCNNEEVLPAEMKVPLTFMNEVEVGELPEGKYTIQFKTLQGIKERSLNIEKAKTRNVDNTAYVITEYAYVKSVVAANQPDFFVNLVGYLNSPCVGISNKINGAIVNDVIILLPEVIKSGRVCPPVAKEFELEVKLKTPPPGRYLLHIRSVNGTAVNRLFTVKDLD